MNHPTSLMLALSAAVLSIDPSVPQLSAPAASSLRENAAHWLAVASYAEAFPVALAKRVSFAQAKAGSAKKVRPAGAPDLARFGAAVAAEAALIKDELG